MLQKSQNDIALEINKSCLSVADFVKSNSYFRFSPCSYQVYNTAQNNKNVDRGPYSRPKTGLWLVQEDVHHLLYLAPSEFVWLLREDENSNVNTFKFRHRY